LPIGSQIVLVDHTERAQTIDNIDELQMVGVVDHHQLSNFSTKGPIDILVRPIASTCSVIYGMRKTSGIAIPQDIARAMMIGIISDTLYFRSPTTTDYDKKIFEELNDIAKIDNTEELSLAMFNAKSDL
jgi:manganese-dependent inorganic pyrophosphatase